MYQNVAALVFRVFLARVKLGFDFPGVTPNQKYRPKSLKFDSDEESHPILGSLKNYSSVKIPNFLHQKTENARNRILLQQKDAPFHGESS